LAVNEISVLLAEDHAIVREGLKLLLSAQGDMDVVGEADNGITAWQKAKELRPCVVVMDVSLPELNGVEATERIKRDCPDVTVLALTVHEERGYLRRLLQAGASGYVLKRAAAKELTQAIRTVVAGGVYLDPRLADKVIIGLIRDQSLKDSRQHTELSQRETEVLRLIALGYGNKEIATRLAISVKTVETYKTRLMEKLDLHSRVDIVRYALRQGWLQ
jgi:DNA-binding NarL/FixJ family response regulator